jgi:hypothetical protein
MSAIFEWLGAHPFVECVSILLGGAAWVYLLVRIANARAPDVPPYQWPRRRRDRDEHADNLGIGS